MVDAADSKSAARKGVRVRVSPEAPIFKNQTTFIFMIIEETPTITLQTMAMAIRTIDHELTKMKELYALGTATAEDDIWTYDLERAAINLEEVYNYTIETKKVINFPKYDKLINRKK